ncbi:MAG: phospholipid/cholesterol/gamma-HCH transport system substrate-binding protein [Solirubrobacteraceae bacterium]|nr:phospholipid/cholesterol/gamma-HCH transport system substrate-binding protein [Solirubrobacteraceae bacterium]
MSTRFPATARAIVAVFLAVTVLLFAVLGARFGGPSVDVGPVTRLHASVPDSQGLPAQADVLVRGVRVGRVTGVTLRGGRADVELALTEAPALHPDASLRIGAKTPLGEPFVDLRPGTAPGRLDPRRAVAVVGSVEVDEALGVLAPRTRADLRALLRETGAGATAAGLAGTVVNLDRATSELRRLGTVLRGQDGDVAATIASGRAVLDELGAHDAALRGIVRDGTATLRAAGARPADLRAALGELPTILARTRATLDAAEPLLRHARPVVADVRAAARPLRGTLRAAVPALRDARALTAALPGLRHAADPVLAAARRLLPVAGPAFARLGPDLANVVPMVRYLAPRTDTISAWFANTSALGQNGDSKGRWARFLVMLDPATALAAPGAPPGNAYTRPGDARDNQPYRAGDFPRLRASAFPTRSVGKG